ncbi:hypothetical protein [Photobacterium leiognathi]|uniref:hypothetical protein n=1 Tax=Photobacterium leiognathi TaxID=553611 RepID=UPI002733D5CB|nr:hypothetical protein [Photobacterium leiognathi]
MLKIAIESILNQTTQCDLLVYQDGNIPVELSSILQGYADKGDLTLFANDINKGWQ